MSSKQLLDLAFNRYANALIILTTLFLTWEFLPLYIWICTIVALFVIFAIVLRPTAKRNKEAWNDLFPRQLSERVQFVDGSHHFREWKLPLLIIVHSQTPFSVKSLPYWNHEAFDSASICVDLQGARVFPLARYFLWKLGGILPASRSVILRLLGRRTSVSSESSSPARDPSSSSPLASAAAAGSSPSKDSSSSSSSSISSSGVVVAFYNDAKLGVSDSTVNAEIASKAVISAALKTGANVASAVQLPEGTIWVGKPENLLSSSSTSSSTQNSPVEVPTLEQVLEASENYCKMLSGVLSKAYPKQEAKVRR